MVYIAAGKDIDTGANTTGSRPGLYYCAQCGTCSVNAQCERCGIQAAGVAVCCAKCGALQCMTDK